MRWIAAASTSAEHDEDRAGRRSAVTMAENIVWITAKSRP